MGGVRGEGASHHGASPGVQSVQRALALLLASALMAGCASPLILSMPQQRAVKIAAQEAEKQSVAVDLEQAKATDLGDRWSVDLPPRKDALGRRFIVVVNKRGRVVQVFQWPVAQSQPGPPEAATSSP